MSYFGELVLYIPGEGVDGSDKSPCLWNVSSVWKDGVGVGACRIVALDLIQAKKK